MRTVLILAFLLSLSSCSPTEEEVPNPLVQVQVAPVRRSQIERKVEAPATLYPAEEATISARLTASVQEMPARKGDAVTRDQVLLLLDASDLEAQRAEAELAVADAEANLLRLQRGTLPGDLEQAKGQVESTRAVLNQALDTYNRRKDLYTEGAIPQKDLLSSETALRQAEIDYQNASRALDLLQNQTSDQDIKIARLRRDQQQARLGLIMTQLQYARIRSPFSGFVTDQFVYPGDMAQPGTPLLKVSDLSSLVARAQVPDSEASPIAVGQDCKFTAVDFPDRALSGKVSVVNRAIDPVRRTVEIWCEVSKPPETARTGWYGQTTFLLGVESGLVVPKSAVQFVEGTNRGTAMLVDNNEIAHAREVETGLVFDDQVEILSGLSEGDTVITEGGYGLPDGTQVHPAKAGSK